MTTKSKLDQAFEDAEKAAENIEVAQAVAPVVTGTAVGEPVKKLGLMSLMNSGNLAVDHFLKVDEYGLHVGTSKTSFELINVKLVNLRPVKVLRFGNPAIYERSYDGISSVKGEAWSTVCARGLKADPTAQEYISAEVQMILEEDLKDAKGTVVAAKGAKIGYSTPPTGQKYVKELVELLIKSGLIVGEELVEEPMITLGFVEVSKNGNVWGNVTFTPT